MTKEEIKKARAIKEKFLEEKRIEFSKTAKTSLPKEEWGVHESHCCFEHGCKYGDDDCPVAIGLIKQKYKCEICSDNEQDEDSGFDQTELQIYLLREQLKEKDKKILELKKKLEEL